jgi:hypothetical protein
MLHITNGHAVSLGDTGLGGEIVYWADVLHEGPVPADLDLDELTRVRAAFLGGHWPQHPCPLMDRDAALRRSADHDEVVLWFEHDLYDQLQLIQILDWFHQHPARLSIICIGEFPGVHPFYGIGQLTGAQLATLWPQRHTVTERELALAADAWRAFRSPDPMSMHELLRQDTSALPFLADALVRHMQEFPSVENGLGRIDRQILEMVDQGFRTMRRMFPEQMLREERSFLGDTVFADHLESLVNCRHPLLENADGEYRLTQTGRDVLSGRADHVHVNGANRWLGGVHFHGSEVLWRWDESRRCLVRH